MTSLTSTQHSVIINIAGWTPGLRTIVRGHVLPCGCLVGEYETWTSDLMLIVDATDPQCSVAAHRVNTILFKQPSHAVRARPGDDTTGLTTRTSH